MASPLSDECKLLIKMLSDGEWYPVEDLMVALAAKVAPGKALRRYERRKENWESKNGPRSGPELSDEQKIASGARTLARVAVASVRQRYCEVRETENGQQIRLRRDFESKLPKVGSIQPDASEKGHASAVVDSTNSISAARLAGEADNTFAGNGSTEEKPDLIDEHHAINQPVTNSSCAKCGLYVVNHTQHEEFHRLQSEDQAPDLTGLITEVDEPPPPPACAFVSEAQLRTMIREELGRMLDDFQDGMEDFLILRFAALERAVREPHTSKPFRGKGAQRGVRR